jgi:hypothetical protein
MDQPAEPTRVVVTVVRTGGLAGLRREWRAEPPADALGRWITLVDGCPWDDPTPPSRGADRYVWRIRARVDDQPEREAELGDGQVAGPWRTLVDEVRSVAPKPSRRGNRGR